MAELSGKDDVVVSAVSPSATRGGDPFWAGPETTQQDGLFGPAADRGELG